MKKKFIVGLIFLSTYLVFLIATLPMGIVLNQIQLPKQISVTGLSGSVWQSQIERLAIEDTTLQKVNVKLSFWSLFTLAPSVNIQFGDPLLSGAEGSLDLILSSENITLKNVSLYAKANEIAQQLTLPLPMTAKGEVNINLPSMVIDQKTQQCSAASGHIVWDKAGIIAFNENVPLGHLSAKVSCENDVLTVDIEPKNNLGLTFTAYLRQAGKISGNGYLKPAEKFPQQLNSALPFLGKKDNQGRYRLSF